MRGMTAVTGMFSQEQIDWLRGEIKDIRAEVCGMLYPPYENALNMVEVLLGAQDGGIREAGDVLARIFEEERLEEALK